MVMGVKAGLDPTTMLDVINAGSGRNTATADKFPRCVVPRRFDFGFTTALLYKDIKLCLDEAEALGVPMIVGNAVATIEASTAGMKIAISAAANIVPRRGAITAGRSSTIA